MFIFTKAGRSAYLQFVRNLPSQVMLLAPCIFFPQMEKFNDGRITNIGLVLLFFVMFIYAAVANWLEFYEHDGASQARKKATAELRESGVTGWRLFLKTIRHKEYLGVLVAMLMAYGGFAEVIFMVFKAYHQK
ncbi:hypothetical protein [Oryzomicrobium sp.]|uniref:hypothetical protein n=1 Tax=Oryzomicrobium sp. TaxID=1911578 RepID=UPI002FE0A73D